MPSALGTRNLVRSAILIILLGAVVVFGRPKLAVILYNHANTLLDQGRFARSKRYLDYSLFLDHSRNGFAYCAMAQALLGQGRNAEAEGYYRRAIAANPFLVQAYVGLAELLRAEDRPEEALVLVRQALETVKEGAQLRVQKEVINKELGSRMLDDALSAFDRRDYAQARTAVNRAMELLPDQPNVYYAAGQVYSSSGSIDEAQLFLRQAVSLDPDYAPAYRLTADIYFDRGQFELAIDHYRRALSAGRDDPLAWLTLTGLGLSHMNLERYQDAEFFLRQAMALHPDDPDLLYSLASVLRDQGKREEAARIYAGVLRLAPHYVHLHNDLADIALQEGRPEQASEEFTVERDARLADLVHAPADVSVLNSLAYAYTGLGAYREAEAYVQKALALQPDSRQAYMTLALVYEHTGRQAQALVALEKAKGFSRGDRFIEEQAAALRRSGRKTFSEK